MSAFGLLTAINVEDVPKILHRVAQGYRGNEGDRLEFIWPLIASEMDIFARELAGKIEEWKKNPPKRKRVMLSE